MARIRSLLLHTLADIAREELDDPRLQLVSFTDLRLARDLTSAEVKVVAAVGGPEASEKCVAALESARHIIWNRLREETDLRIVPELRFTVDRGPQYEREIEALIQALPPAAEDDGDPDITTDDDPEQEDGD
ncbi:30S ribosome-binding factor RbfA [bacterium]|nr:30S ribosome-binding factor RbfA [bacterium]